MFDELKLKSLLALKSLTVLQLCEKAKINPATYYRKVKNKESFTRDEIQRISEVIGTENIRDIFFC